MSLMQGYFLILLPYEFPLGKMTSGNTLNYGSISHWTLTTVRHGCESDYSQL